MHFIILGAGLFITWLVLEIALVGIKSWMAATFPPNAPGWDDSEYQISEEDHTGVKRVVKGAICRSEKRAERRAKRQQYHLSHP